ncbi:putative ankyrin repeat protein [Phytophthora citrophthora]|uniref:Ankyrin repeat protein n=1 Tax=Phytophthora citrophthora TaxID=4793 RepID=A0AAD9GBM3_9STRA|nr:putative ankyrin repeat protein [Phytophthora citrophthora]
MDHLVLHKAAAAGHVESLQWFQDNGIYTTFDTGALVLAAEAGQLEVVQWMLDRDRTDDKLKDGYGTGIRYDFSRRQTFLTSLGGEAGLAINSAAVNGHLEVAKLLHANTEKYRNQVEIDTNESRRLYRMKDLDNCFDMGSTPKDTVREVSGETMMLAVERGLLDVVKWLYSVYTQYHADRTMNLFWAREDVNKNGFISAIDTNDLQSTYYSVVDAAAGSGHLEIMQYLLQVGGGDEDEEQTVNPFRKLRFWFDMPLKAKCTTAAMDMAAAHGHLGIVQWLHANCSEGCTTAAMDLAAENGHLEIVKWLHANRKEGCTSDAMNGASARGHLHVVKWLHEHTTEGCTTDAMDNAAGGGHLEVLKWLHENRTEGCTAAAMDGAATGNHVDIVEWLHNHGAECTTGAMDGVAHGGHLRLLRWLFESRKEGFTSEALRNATHNNQFETALILHNIAQQGLAKEIEIMDTEQSDDWIAQQYLQMAEKFRTLGFL